LRCRELGVRASTSSDGMHALLAIAQSPPDLAIVDLNMKVLSGVGVCERLAADAALRPIPVIVMTGYSDAATIRRCLELGAHYVPKGVETWDRIKPLICNLLELKSVEPDPGTVPCSLEVDTTLPRVLAIDDDPAIPKCIQMRLKPLGVEVLCAT